MMATQELGLGETREELAYRMGEASGRADGLSAAYEAYTTALAMAEAISDQLPRSGVVEAAEALRIGEAIAAAFLALGGSLRALAAASIEGGRQLRNEVARTSNGDALVRH